MFVPCLGRNKKKRINDAKYRLKSLLCQWFSIDMSNNNERNSIDPIKYRFLVDGMILFFHWSLFLLYAIRWLSGDPNAWSHYNFAIWPKFDGWFQRKNIILNWVDWSAKKASPHTIYPFFSLFDDVVVVQKLLPCMNVSFTIISNLIEVERTSKVKIANKLCVLSFIRSIQHCYFLRNWLVCVYEWVCAS